MKLRGVMLDMARVTEKHAYYRALPERLAGWGYNTLFAHFNDDEGCAMAFRSRPELATPHAFTQPAMRRWVKAAAAAGITVIPEIESFGHTAFIHKHERYARLREPTGGRFNALNPLARETRVILRDLVRETAEVFDAPYIHAGLDEVNFGASRQVRRALETRELWELFADHIRFMHGLITATGKRMIMWGDHLYKDPRIADNIPKDIIICDWRYYAHVNRETVETFTRRGFEVVAAPASNRAGDIVMPNALTQLNVQRFARIAHDVAADGGSVMGLLNTVWCPMRMLCGIEQFALALGGAWFQDPSADPIAVTTEFLRRHYGLARPAGMAKALLRLSAIMPRREMLSRMMDSEVEPRRATAWLTACEAAQARDVRDEALRLGTCFAAGLERVECNQAEFANYVLAADVLAWAGAVGVSRAEGAPGSAAARRALQAEGRALLKRVRADWSRGRYADDPQRGAEFPGRWNDALIPNLALALRRLEEA